MQTTELTVCSLNQFGEDVKHFWMNRLSGLLERHPQLEFPGKADFYILIIVEEAEGDVFIDNQKIHIDGATAIIIKPRSIYSINMNRKAKGKIICFSDDFFSLRYNNNILYQFSFLQRDAKNYLRFTKEQCDHWSILIELLEKEYDLMKRETMKVLRSYLNIILFELERIYNPKGFVSNKKLKHEKIQQFEMLIEENFIQSKLPSEYADKLHLSPNYLNKICKDATGHTAGDLIRKRVTIEAQRLLHYTNYTVNEIAEKLGFESASYFVTFFRKQTNFTPEQFRKSQD